MIDRLRDVDWSALIPLRDALERSLDQVLDATDEQTSAERELDALLRAHPRLDNAGRRATAEALYGVAVWRLRLWHRLPAEARKGPHRSRALLFAFAVDRAGLTEAHASALAGFTLPLQPLDAGTPAAVRLGFPSWLCAHFAEELGDAALEPFLTALNEPGPLCLRTQLTRAPSREALAQRLAQGGIQTRPTLHSPWGLLAQHRFNVLGTAAHREGWFEVQDEGSQLLGLHVGAQPGERVLELCAGAGGKSLLLAACVGPTGEVIACDVDRVRLGRLRQRALRSEALHIHIRPDGPQGVGEVDRVMVDAPCSELGSLRRGPDRRHRLQPGDLTRWVPVQEALLAQGATHVRPGGTLLYATCTLNRRENQDVVEAFLRARTDFERAEPDRSWLPHLHGTDGFYAARLSRRSR